MAASEVLAALPRIPAALTRVQTANPTADLCSMIDAVAQRDGLVWTQLPVEFREREVLVGVERVLPLIDRHQRGGDDRRCTVSKHLVRPEKVHLVLDDWTTDESAELLLIEGCLRTVREPRKVVTGIERLCTCEEKSASLQLVRSRARDDADDSAGRLPRFG